MKCERILYFTLGVCTSESHIFNKWLLASSQWMPYSNTGSANHPQCTWVHLDTVSSDSAWQVNTTGLNHWLGSTILSPAGWKWPIFCVSCVFVPFIVTHTYLSIWATVRMIWVRVWNLQRLPACSVAGQLRNGSVRHGERVYNIWGSLPGRELISLVGLSPVYS